ncbi:MULTISPECIES: FecR family protein [unclassified Pseudomonas]|uniref:FecR family protein n=1 Tax=unclassified Pseudomonas TaxID=196821 RepID=UPI0021BA5684|nr:MULTISPECIES: FecR domain-containing protein [unclassified Pseudomonas]
MTDVSTMPASPPIRDLSDDALQWQVLLHSGTASAADQARYQRWKQLSLDHTEAAVEAEMLWLDLGSTATAQAFEALPPRPRRKRWSAGIAAALVLVVAGYCGWQEAPLWLADYHTRVGERQSITLDDGSKVLLNSASAVSVAFSATERRVTLRAGEALFDTVADPRPFVVETAGDTVQGANATFSVRRDGQVVLAKGQARLGDQVLAVAADASALTAWQRGKLIFNGKPLGQVLAELERYQHGRIVVPDSKLAALEVSGVFDLDDPHALLRTLEQRYGLKVTYLPWLAVVY